MHVHLFVIDAYVCAGCDTFLKLEYGIIELQVKVPPKKIITPVKAPAKDSCSSSSEESSSDDDVRDICIFYLGC